MTTSTFRVRTLAVATAGALAVTAVTPSLAAPVMSNTTAVKSAVNGDVIDVRWRGRGVGLGIAAGVAGAAIAGAAAANSYYGPGYYAPGYYDGYYATAPGYYAPDYSYSYAPRGYYYRQGNCPVDGGYGRLDYSMC